MRSTLVWAQVLLLLVPHAAQAWDPAAPWTAPAGTAFPYQGLENDLGRLLAVQASPNQWVSMVTMTAKIRRFVVNCLFTLAKYGNQPHYIVATFDPASLAECMRLNLPCLNAESFSVQQIQDGEHGFGSQNAVAMWWGKQNLTAEIIRRGYSVHGSDVDVVYFRDVNKSYDRIFQDSQADGIFAAEEGGPGEPWVDTGNPESSYINMINAGVYALRANARTLDFLYQWTGPLGKRHMDQVYLNYLHTQAYFFCDSHTTCRSVQAHNKFALLRHPFFFPGTSCMRDFRPDEGCDTRRLYLHFLCSCCWESKSNAWNRNSLWFVDENLQPMWEDAGGSHGRHPFLPCAEQVAWPNWKIYT